MRTPGPAAQERARYPINIQVPDLNPGSPLVLFPGATGTASLHARSCGCITGGEGIRINSAWVIC